MFLDDFVVKPIDSRRWELYKEFRYGHDYSTITIPKGFQTDYASVPRLFWVLVPPWGNYGRAAVVHDYLYKNQDYTRKECDDIFRDAMVSSGVKKWRISIMYRAVRWFGIFAWRGYK